MRLVKSPGVINVGHLINQNVKQSKGQKFSKANYGFLNSPKKRTKDTILSIEEAQDIQSYSFFGRIEDTINCFRDLLNFSTCER